MSKVKTFFILAVVFFCLSFSAVVNAIEPAAPGSGGSTAGGCDAAKGTCELPNPLAASGATSPEALIGVIVKGVLGVVGAVALLMFIWGGFLWLTAAGSPERVKKGQQTIIWATLGLGVIFTSYALVRFVLQSVGV